MQSTKLITLIALLISLLTISATHFISFNPGCITSANQNLNEETAPATITATAATGGGCNGYYTYQWQKSTDNIVFTDIAGATSQNLSFSSAVSQTTYYQRKAVCGNEIKWTRSVAVYVLLP